MALAIGFVVCGTFCMPSTACADEGRLERVRSEVASSAEPRNDSKSCEGSADDGDLLGALLEGFGTVALSCWASGCERMEFPCYPYAWNPDGYASPVSLNRDPARRRQNWTRRVWLQTGVNFDDLSFTGGGVLLLSNDYWGASADAIHYRERLPGRSTDALTIGKANLLWSHAIDQSFVGYLGVGGRWLADGGRGSAGMDFGYGCDFFLQQPVVVSAWASGGWLGSASVFETRGSVGWLVNRWEAQVGYHYMQIGSTPLHGPFLGLRVWF